VQTATVLQKKENQKSPDSSVIQEREKCTKTGVPVFLQRNAVPGSPLPVQQKFEEDDDLLEKPVLPKLKVGAPDDEYEQEADRVAETVMRMPETKNTRIVEEDEKPEQKEIVRTKAISPFLCQRLSLDSDEERYDDSDVVNVLQKKSAEGSSSFHHVDGTLLSSLGGSPLPEHVRSKIEPVLGRDLSHVMVHSDSKANQAASSIHAKAFTHRDRIYLGTGQSTHDTELMAHESTHVVQQQGVDSGSVLQRLGEDITRMCITERYASGLSDDELMRDIGLCTDQLQLLSPDAPEYQSAYDNLRILDAESELRNFPMERITACTPRERQAEYACMRAAANATTGIQLYLTADLSENQAARVRIADLFHAGPYLIAPNITSDDENPEVVFYIAYHQARRQNEWVIGPDSIRNFTDNVAMYEGAANVAYPGSARIPETLSGHSQATGRPLRQTVPDEGLHIGGFGAGSAISGYDAQMRLKYYVRPAEDLARRILADVNAGRISPAVGRDMAVAGRNQALHDTRSRLSPGGRSFSRAMKEEGKTVSELINRYSRRLIDQHPDIRSRYGLDAIDASSDAYRIRYNQVLREIGESSEVSTEIIRAAGRPNRIITGVARVNRILGPVGTAVSLAISGYEIYDAPEGQRMHVIARETGGFAGGTLGAIGGGMVGGWVASLACGPAAPVCALIVSIICVGAGGYLGGRAGEEIITNLPSLLLVPAYIPLAFPAHSLSAGGGYAGLMERDRRVLLEASRPLWMRLNEAIQNVQRDIRTLEGQIRTAENREELENLQRLRLDLLFRLEDLHLLYEYEYPEHRRQVR